MRITARGWNRNMGSTEIANISISELPINRRDGNRHISFSKPGLFDDIFRTWVAWGKNLTLGGNYRLEVEFFDSDILQLFKARFGSQLQQELLQEHGFTVSPEFEKVILSGVKLTDITLGDLMKMAGGSGEDAAQTEKPAESKPTGLGFLRRNLS
jgi:hypothetical protein